jgi:chaperonin GroES
MKIAISLIIITIIFFIMQITPLANRVVVKLVKTKKTTASGIILSTEDKNEQSIGEIIAIGAGLGDEENVTKLGLNIGDKVLFGKYSGESVKDETDPDTEYKIINGKDIFAIIS